MDLERAYVLLAVLLLAGWLAVVWVPTLPRW